MRFKNILLTSAVSAVVALSSGVAYADEITTITGPTTKETIYGAGASLPAPYFRQAADCYSAKLDLIFTAPAPVNSTATTMADFNYAPPPPKLTQNCATTDYITNREIFYVSTGSGVGIQAIFSGDPARAGDTKPNEAGVQPFARIDYALSETALGNAEVNIYNNGGTNSTVGVVTVGPNVTPGAGQYPNAKQAHGALIQFPLLIAPVAIAYDPVYKKTRAADGSITEYSFRNRWERADQSGGLHLTQALVCGIFNGSIKNWNNADIRTANKGSSLKDDLDGSSFTVPLQIVGREDSSGTTSLWTRFLAKACESVPGNAYLNSSSRLPGSYTDSTGSGRSNGSIDLVGAVWNKNTLNYGPTAAYYSAGVNGAETTGKYTLANGNDGVAKYINFAEEPSEEVGNAVTQGRIGYAGPDYVLPGVLFTESNDYNLKSVDVQNLAGTWKAPTRASALAAYSNIAPPEADPVTGAFVKNESCGTDTVSGKCRSNPADWVEPADKASSLANPTDVQAYPIVGTTNVLTYTCSTRGLVARTQTSFWNYYYTKNNTITDSVYGLLVGAGFSPVPEAYRRAIKETFFTPSDPLGLELVLGTKGGAKPEDAKCN